MLLRCSQLHRCHQYYVVLSQVSHITYFPLKLR
jgi:hypothetical protein